MYQVINDVGTRAGRPPRSGVVQLRRRTNEHRDVPGTHERGIGGNLGSRADSQQDFARKLARADPFPAANVIHLARNARSHER